MGARRTSTVIDPALMRFAHHLRDQIGAEHVWLFGLDKDDPEHEDDIELIIVSPRFAGMEWRQRQFGLHDLWYAAGGTDPLHLICATPEEMIVAQQRATLVAAVLPEAIDLLQLARTPDEVIV